MSSERSGSQVPQLSSIQLAGLLQIAGLKMKLSQLRFLVIVQAKSTTINLVWFGIDRKQVVVYTI